MNNLAYMGQDGQTVAPKVEELLNKELGEGRLVRHEAGRAGRQRDQNPADLENPSARERRGTDRRYAATVKIHGIQRLLRIEGVFGTCRPVGSDALSRRSALRNHRATPSVGSFVNSLTLQGSAN